MKYSYRIKIVFLILILLILLPILPFITYALNNELPIGYFDGITTDGIVYGWAVDPDFPSDSIQVHFYLDGPYGTGKLIGYTLADKPSPDLPYPGNHRFSYKIPDAYRDGTIHTLYVHAINVPEGTNPILNGSPKYFSISNISPPSDLNLVQTDYLVGAFYFPGWKMGAHSAWTKIDYGPYLERKPLLGFYDEGNPEVANQQIKWALENGISFFIYNWYRSKPRYSYEVEKITSEPITVDSLFLGHAIHNGFLKSRYKNWFKFAVMLAGDKHAPDVYSMADLEQNLMPFLISNYFKDPSYLKINNKPLLFIYDWELFKKKVGDTDLAMREAINKMRNLAKNAGFDDLIILGNDRQTIGTDGLDGIRNLKNFGFDYAFAYNWWMTEKNPSTQYIIDRQLQMLNNWKNANILPFLPTVSMGWDSYPWDKNSDNPKWRLTPDEFKTVLNNTKNVIGQFPGDNLGRNMILLDNWNEYGEGHYIEPHSQYKFGYLQSVREIFTKKDNNPDYQFPSRLYDSFYQDYLKHIVTPKLVAYYNFENNVIDVSGEGHNGIIHGQPVLTQGKIGRAYNFNGVDDWIEIPPHYKLQGLNQITFGGWIKLSELPKVAFTPFGMDMVYRAVIFPDGSGHCVISTENNQWYKTGTVASWKSGVISADKWHYVNCVYNNYQVIAYVDGKQVGISDSNISRRIDATWGWPLTIGKAIGDNTNHLKGIIDEVKIWNYALTSEQILKEYLMGLADTILPTTPTNLTATPVSSSQINLSWSASTDNVGVSGYKIYRCQGSNCTPTVQIATSTTNFYSDTGLSPSTTYTYKVAAFDAAGNVSIFSSSVSATTFSQTPSIFVPPTISAPTTTPTKISTSTQSSTSTLIFTPLNCSQYSSSKDKLMCNYFNTLLQLYNLLIKLLQAKISN